VSDAGVSKSEAELSQRKRLAMQRADGDTEHVRKRRSFSDRPSGNKDLLRRSRLEKSIQANKRDGKINRGESNILGRGLEIAEQPDNSGPTTR
jgi:hypothetical protein